MALNRFIMVDIGEKITFPSGKGKGGYGRSKISQGHPNFERHRTDHDLQNRETNSVTSNNSFHRFAVEKFLIYFILFFRHFDK